MIVYTPPSPPNSIPVVDLDGSDVPWEIHKACRETGFFYVANHGVPQALVDAQFEWAGRFFDLPLEQKLAVHMAKSPTTAGYEPLGHQQLDSQDAASEKAPPDIKEGFQCAMELADDHPLARERRRGFGHNLWPVLLPGFREQMLAYQAALRQLGNRMLALLARSLELPEHYFFPYYQMPGLYLRILRYPPHPAAARANQLGAGAHTDWGGVTMLAQDEIGGLEIRNAAGEWIRAIPVPGTFVINLGDLMQRWTNGLYCSTMHRVKNNSSSRNRHSVAFFYAPSLDALIECLPTCTDAGNPPKFPTVTTARHMSEMFERSYGYAPAA
jgi:isopenicillin N synthase-like dioxygenase